MKLVLLLSAVCFLAYAYGGTIMSILWSWLLTRHYAQPVISRF